MVLGVSVTRVFVHRARPTARECLGHRWLARRSPPPVSPSATPHIITVTPKPEKQELDVAKDNLKLFVERWSEHPNSPYVFDNEAHEITLLANGERSSIGGCSPSPRSSLSSSPDIFDEEDLRPPTFREFNPVRYNPVTRRASDSTCFLHKRADVLVRKNLAEEIKKLSDHLFMLSTMNTDLSKNNNNSVKEPNKNVDETKTITKEDKKLTNGFKKEAKTTVTKTLSNGTGDGKQNKLVTSKSSHKVTSTFFKNEPNKPVTSNMPWAKSSRSKKITTSSRDVPDQPTDRRNSFLDVFDKRREKIDKFVNGTETIATRQLPYRRGDDNNAHRTKDLLLRLLEKWGESEESEAERSVGGTSANQRHQSISFEWSPSTELAQNSMSSLHAFYQRQSSDEKKQRKKVSTTVQNGN